MRAWGWRGTCAARATGLESGAGVCQGEPGMWTCLPSHRLLSRILTGLLLLGPAWTATAQIGPQGAVRQFCQADGTGQRVTILGWAALAPLVSWPYEPAWDQVALISGYTVGSPRPTDGDALAIDVRYGVIGRLSPWGLDAEVHSETVTFVVRPDEHGSWRIDGPPPPPHIFADRVDMDAMRRSLSSGGPHFLANTVFVWQMFRSVGWNVQYESTAELLSDASYRAVDTPKPGDLVVYLRNDTPYHVGLLEAENQVVSSTLNAGITRAPVDAFPGGVRYLRLLQPAPMPERPDDRLPPAALLALQELSAPPAPALPAATATPAAKRPPAERSKKSPAAGNAAARAPVNRAQTKRPPPKKPTPTPQRAPTKPKAR